MPKDRKQKKKEKRKAADRRREEERKRQKQAIARQLEEMLKRPRPESKVEHSAPIPEEEPQEMLASEGLDLEPADEWWDAFESADLENKSRLFLQTLNKGRLDEEYAFEMLNTIHAEMDRKDPAARARFAELIDHLRRQAPKLYRHDIQYYHQMLIEHAVIEGNWAAIPELLTPFSIPKNIDTFMSIQEMLLYHGQGRLLIPVMIEALPKLEKSKDVFPWVAEEVAQELMSLMLYEYLETTQAPRPDDPAIVDATAPYGKWEEGWLERFIPRLTATTPSLWRPEDFGPAVDADQWIDNLNNLLAEFMAERKRAGVSYTRTHMVWEILSQVLQDQLASSALPSKKEQQKSKKENLHRAIARTELSGKSTRSPLIPTFGMMDKALGKLFPMLGAGPYKAVAVIELLPAYLHFLARAGLIHPDEMDSALNELKKLGQEIALAIFENYSIDPTAINAVREAWSTESLDRLRNDPELAQARAAPIETRLPPSTEPPRRSGQLTSYLFKVTYLQDPEVWRTIEILGNQTLDDLHEAIQSAVSFANDHLYAFFMTNKAWDESAEYVDPRAGRGRSASLVKIDDLNLRMKQRFLYLFDYGDEHRFEVQWIGENPIDPAAKRQYPRLVERHGKNPPQYGF